MKVTIDYDSNFHHLWPEEKRVYYCIFHGADQSLQFGWVPRDWQHVVMGLDPHARFFDTRAEWETAYAFEREVPSEN